ncbi:4'-phosphopantetheinyl transferase superfamily protein [Polaribacter sp. IC073]|uniref:4'-phosphopantetheinyl transferase family protein n=1 Tax=Polaribacter sp. IC073 TaxID=2508540 RepID=UPI0011BD5A20|nr:4'-phosphopantetheinyl transferase superfamily protein [Polaribacter sp. IC073]TXD49931.1 4-phosphopantetheinyl transferase family protein [Polaribacter sp. IC073]
MHNIGNDIVDLNLAETESNWQRKGFLEKQFTKKEQQEICEADTSFLTVWLFWSMKEAAYKCYTQKVKKRFFAPLKFECRLISNNEGVVLYEGNKYHTITSFNSFYIHTIAKETDDEINFFLNIDSSETIHSDFKKQLAVQTGILSEEIEKRKSVIGAPLFYHQQKLLTKSCSISHHGNYGAFVFILNNES